MNATAATALPGRGPLTVIAPDASRWERLVYSVQTRASRWAWPRLAWLNRIGARVTVRDLFSTPGDTLVTAILCRHLKQRWPRLRLNCVTRNPDLLTHDPHLDELNGPLGLFVADFWYLDIQQRRDKHTHILARSLAMLGLAGAEYRARVYLTEAERAAARARLAGIPAPRLSLNTLSAFPVKNWPLEKWQAILPELARRGALVQLGDDREPDFPGALRLAGQLSRRESLAVLGECAVHLGPDSFLMHGANGLDVPSVIIYGGSRTPANLGYAANRNLYTEMACSGCWLSGLPGSECPYGLACMEAISPAMVLAAVDELLAQPRPVATSE
jgi:ADP-heptose:LPS heptosyltransferase